MDRLEKYLEMARTMGLKVHEEKMSCHDGLLIGKDIILREDIPTSAKKTDVLVEEIAHSELTVGNILDQTDANNRRQERKARLRAAEMQVPLQGIVDAFRAHCRSSYETAEFLDVSEDTLREALELYRQVYGAAASVDGCIVRFEPRLSVYEVIMIA